MKEISDINTSPEIRNNEFNEKDISIMPEGDISVQQADDILRKLVGDQFESSEADEEPLVHREDGEKRIGNPQDLSLKDADEIFEHLFEDEDNKGLDSYNEKNVYNPADMTNQILESNNLNSDVNMNENNDNTEDTDSESADDGEEKPQNPHTEVIEGVTYYYDDNGNLYRVGNDLTPNNEYELNGYKYKTDEKGRIISAEGKLHLKNHEGRLTIRDSIDDIGKGDQQEGDDRGHLIGDQFDGSNGLENMIPQDAEINRNEFKAFEKELADAVKEGKEVYVSIEPIYDGDSRRPVAIVVTYSIDGEVNVRVFPNGKDE